MRDYQQPHEERDGSFDESSGKILKGL